MQLVQQVAHLAPDYAREVPKKDGLSFRQPRGKVWDTLGSPDILGGGITNILETSSLYERPSGEEWATKA